MSIISKTRGVRQVHKLQRVGDRNVHFIPRHLSTVTQAPPQQQQQQQRPERPFWSLFPRTRRLPTAAEGLGAVAGTTTRGGVPCGFCGSPFRPWRAAANAVG